MRKLTQDAEIFVGTWERVCGWESWLLFLEAWTSIVHRGRAKVREAGRSLWSESWVCLQKHFCLKVPQTPVAQEMPSQMFISKMTAISQVPIAFICLSLLVWERPLARNLDRFLGGKREPFLPLGIVREEGTWLTSSQTEADDAVLPVPSGCVPSDRTRARWRG